MKKFFIAAGLILLIAISIITSIMLLKDNKPSEEVSTAEFSEEYSSENKNEYTPLSQSSLTVDSWLKISEITEINGRLAVVAENISDTDVEYAVLTVRSGDKTYSFNASVLLKNTKVLLVCNEAVNYDTNASYSLWETDNIINFTTPPSKNEETFEISVLNGSVSVKNISDKNIDSDVFIYYKTRSDGFLDGSITHKIKLSGLATSAVTYINTPELNENNCEIMFVQY